MTNVRIKLKNVRLSFPSLFKKATFEGVETKYEATFIIDKSDKKTIEAIKAEINNLIEEGKVRLPRDKQEPSAFLFCKSIHQSCFYPVSFLRLLLI
jgi:hypothetical protein